MFTQKQCLAKAAEAEALAAAAPLEADRIRLQIEAASWRERATRASPQISRFKPIRR